MPIKSTGGGYPVRFSVPGQRWSKIFRTQEELRLFLMSEIKHWQEQNEPRNFPLPGGPQGLQFLDPLTTRIFQDALNTGPHPEEALKIVEQRGAILSEGLYGRLLSNFKTEKPNLYPGAVAAIAASLGPGNPWPDQSGRQPFPWAVWLSGLGAVMELAPSKVTKAEADQLTSLISDTLAHRDQTEEMKHDFELWRDKTTNEIGAEIRNFRQSTGDALKSAQAQLAQALYDSNSRILDLEEKVRTRLVLEAPTTYWSDKANGHVKIALGFGVLFLLALGGGIYWLTHYGVDLVADAHTRIVGNVQDPGLLALVPLAFITLPTLAFAWLLRHVSRVIVQNLTLGADARLRGTIATTYSALTIDQGASPAELAIVFNALFRPVDGSTHSEIAPPNLSELMDMATKK
ncbi:DUF6161 domain-containing protein [Mesorhizobium sp.]|uniref:DUF6161 domain-containing protein n=1 Tax=Mesorhizobium sp. TaxID=1871066 RepID=UPI000FE5FF60|nr:DUF6161 domain-containing protein [Mesorhizobium sp.]RWA67457.1 MAG: hypothetical protein EOQ29_23415 [Mesorhizobium sp.]RWA78745.1 MAG: hypothetical protein EOQ30_28455 [Mesorhizobium sp.]RWB14378.1 MAG: hypothetical protein EOQ40_30015 [Mesorhizobium sp.]